ncbi:uncharacterized protein LOC131879990 isoform X2 [Tigriopus californicus]|uniref:uncharacterized protein LOC131879990 isoform X2 n=1 Tax=Tigriopus californicus TaxID=6832 RepID=UPI0027DA050C|nr:uncharacterized protein LOC131879990 isoform X2 [Tigriopus californicus]
MDTFKKPLLLAIFGLVIVKSQSIGNISVNAFVTFEVAPWSVDDAKVKEVECPTSGWSNMTCGAICVATNKCTGYTVDGNKCLLLESWRYAHDPEPHEAVTVFGQKLSEPSQIMVVGGHDMIRGNVIAKTEVALLDLKNQKYCPDPPQLPSPIFGAPSLLVGNKLWLLGGFHGSNSVKLEITEFDFKTLTWGSVGEFPERRTDFASAQIRDSWVIVMGGWKGSDFASNHTMVIYANGTQKDGPPLPAGSYGPCGGGLDEDHIILVGGIFGRSGKETHVLNWPSQQWERKADTSLETYNAACERFTNKHNQISFMVVASTFDKPFIYTWATDTWHFGEAFATSLYKSVLFNFDGNLYTSGGGGSLSNWNQDVLTDIFAFNPENETWSQYPLDLKIPRRAHSILKIPAGIFDC